MNTVIIRNARKTLIELPTFPATRATGREILEAAQFDTNGVMVEPALRMERGTVLKAGCVGARLLPGENTVDATYWERARTVHGVKLFLACGYLENLGEGKATHALGDLDDMSPAVAKEQIEKCDSMALLEKWGEATESRALAAAVDLRKAWLIENATGEPKSVRGGAIKDQDPLENVFGEGTTPQQSDGGGVSMGTGEAPMAAPTPAPAPRPAPAPKA